MSDVASKFDADLAEWVVGGALAVIAGLLVLVWPGPIALTDRLPFALVLLAPGVIAMYHAYAESKSPV